MKITFAGQVLADDAALQWCSGDSLAADRGVSLDEYPQADYATPRDLGNATVQYAFSAFKSHATLRAAQVYYLTHGQEATGQGDAVLATEGNAQTRYLRDAICTARAASLRGLSTLFEYTLLGTLVTGLVAGGLQGTSTLRAPGILAEDTAILELSHLGGTSTFNAPAVADSGADTMAAGGLASSSTLAAPFVGEREEMSASHLASTSTLNSPTLSEPSPPSYLSFAGTDVLTTPDSAENSITGDFEVLCRVRRATWLHGSHRFIIGKRGPTTADRVWRLMLSSGNDLQLLLYDASLSIKIVTSDDLYSLPDATRIWLRVTYAASTQTTTFGYSLADVATPPSVWTTIPVDSNGNSIGSTLNDSTHDIEIGNGYDGSTPWDGDIYYVELKDGIGGATVARFDAADGTDPTFNNVAGQTAWTNSGATFGTD